MSSLYVCLFSNGHIKVGRSTDPVSRIASHADRVACIGVELIDSRAIQCQGNIIRAERDLIEWCVAMAAKRNKSEWFEGLDFAATCAYAESASERSFVDAPRPAPSAPDPALVAWLAELRYRCTWPEGIGGSHKWVDARPDEPHWPDSAVSRWDLRQRDWHKIWPELIDHPCAILFAPTHPNREGRATFADWTKSWPDGFTPVGDMKLWILELFDRGVCTPQDLRPKDWWLIWPELINTDGAPAVPDHNPEINHA